MNHMEVIAKLLGVELGEEFRIIEANMTHDGVYKLTEDTLLRNDDGENWVPKLSTLARLLNGSLSIKKQPWRPRKGETYWFIYPKHPENDYSESSVYRGTYDGHLEQVLNIRIGNCFKKPTDAQEHLEAFVAWMRSDTLLNWKK